MRTLKFTKAESRQYQYAYQQLLFPRKPEFNSQEEIGLANLLAAFEKVGEAVELSAASGGFTSYVLPENTTEVAIDISDERDFTLLKQIVDASQTNGIWVRDKLALKKKLEENKVAEV